LAQLRWILAALGALAIAAIWWWSTRRSGQAPGNSELRESSVMPMQSLTPAADARPDPHDHSEPRERGGARQDRTISPLEPLSIRTGDFERMPVLDLSMTANREPGRERIEDVDYIESSMSALSADSHPDSHPSIDVEIDMGGDDEPAALEPQPQPPVLPRAAPVAQPTRSLASGLENGDRPAAHEPAAANVSEQQKIVTLRVCAVGDERWSGRELMSALEGHGLAYGRYQVYHRKHADGQSIFYVASLIEPGTFDAVRMPEEEFRGVSMFAVLPGPLEPLQAVDALLATARELARELSGTVQDAKGMPFSPQRIAALREDVARFRPAARGPAA
jgi:cell division protein ZipA